MLGLIRITGLGLCIGLGYLLLGEPSAAVSASPAAKSFQERVSDSVPAAAAPSQADRREVSGKADRLLSGDNSCAAQTWPYLSQECLAPGAVQRPSVRTITQAQPAGPSTTNVVRVPAVVLASR